VSLPLARQPFFDAIVAIAKRHGVSVPQLVSPGGSRKASRARADVWRHLRSTTNMSLPDLGALFGRRHTSVLFAINDTYRARHQERSARRSEARRLARRQRIVDGIAVMRVV